MAGKENRHKPKHSLVSTKCHPMKIRKRVLEDTRPHQATKVRRTSSVTSISSKCHPMVIRKRASADTRLQQATKSRSIASVTSILKAKSKDHISESTLDACLLMAAETGQRRILQLLSQNGANVNTKDINGYTPLMISSERGFYDIVRSLVKCDADVELRNKTGKTAFLLAVEHSCCLALLEYFICDAYADVNVQDKNGTTALMLAVERWDIEAMEMLFREKKTNMNLKDQQGRTAYQIAQKCGLGDLFSLFIECYRANKKSQRPLKLAVKKMDRDLIRLMLDCDYSKINEPNFTPLMAAFNDGSPSKRKGSLEIAKILISAGADIRKRSGRWSALLLAARTGNVEGVRLLIEKGADINEKSSFLGETALMVASQSHHVDVVAFLISKKADITSKCRWGSTALKSSIKYLSRECSQLLLESGAAVDEDIFITAMRNGQHRLFSKVDENLVCKDVLNSFYF